MIVVSDTGIQTADDVIASDVHGKPRNKFSYYRNENLNLTIPDVRFPCRVAVMIRHMGMKAANGISKILDEIKKYRKVPASVMERPTFMLLSREDCQILLDSIALANERRIYRGKAARIVIKKLRKRDRMEGTLANGPDIEIEDLEVENPPKPSQKNFSDLAADQVYRLRDDNSVLMTENIRLKREMRELSLRMMNLEKDGDIEMMRVKENHRATVEDLRKANRGGVGIRERALVEFAERMEQHYGVKVDAGLFAVITYLTRRDK